MVSIGDVNLLLVIYRQEQDAVNSDLDRDNRCFIVIVHHSSWGDRKQRTLYHG